MAFLTQQDWDEYRAIIDDAGDTFNKQVIVWKRFKMGLDYDGEDPSTQYTDINLEVLISYNFFRTWPITQQTVTGEIDKESVVVLINMDYLRNLGYTTANDYFNFQPGKDLFVIKGDTYEAVGDTDIAQAKGTTLLFQIIMRRVEIKTGSKPHK